MKKSTRILASAALSATLAFSAQAQFTGPSQGGDTMSVAAIQDVNFGSYVTVEGNITVHLREDYYMFRDATGEMMVEIPSQRFGGRKIDPDMRVSLMGEVDQRSAGQRYVWVKSLTVL